MTNINLRKHQLEAVSKIKESLEDNDKCLVKMFCGTGKTRIVFYIMMNHDEDLLVIVFPSIALITQFNNDYVLNDEWKHLTNKFKYMSICSKNELDDNIYNIKYTTDEDIIQKFITNKKKKIITCTYQSLDTFFNAINNTDKQIGLMIYDEAHHIIGSKIQDLVFNKIDATHTIFLTATPKNDNGIIMLERIFDDDDYDYYTDCGTLAYEYSHLDAVNDGICNDFDIAIDFYTDKNDEIKNNKYKYIHQAISRSIINTNNTRMLTFHSRSETEHDDLSDVVNFVKSKKSFDKEFNHVLTNEFIRRL